MFKINEMRADGIINYSLLNVLSTECRRLVMQIGIFMYLTNQIESSKNLFHSLNIIINKYLLYFKHIFTYIFAYCVHFFNFTFPVNV